MLLTWLRGEQTELLDRLNAGDSGELDVDQHDVWASVEHELEGVFSVAGLADDVELVGRERLPVQRGSSAHRRSPRQ
jgi:hypothetical protein